MKKLLVGFAVSVGVLTAAGTAFAHTTTTTVERFSQQQLEQDLAYAMNAPSPGMTFRNGQFQAATGHENDSYMSDAGRYCMEQADIHHVVGHQNFMVACLREILQNGLRVHR